MLWGFCGTRQGMPLSSVSLLLHNFPRAQASAHLCLSKEHRLLPLVAEPMSHQGTDYQGMGKTTEWGCVPGAPCRSELQGGRACTSTVCEGTSKGHRHAGGSLLSALSPSELEKAPSRGR